MKLSDLKIGARLAAGIGLLLVLMLVVAGVALTKMVSLRGATTEIASNWLPSVSMAQSLNTSTSNFRLAEVASLRATDEDAINKAEKGMSAALSEIAKDSKGVAALLVTDEEKKLFQQFEQKWSAYMTTHAQIKEYVKANTIRDARALFDGASSSQFDEASAALDAIVAFNEKGAETARAAAETAFSDAKLTLGAAVVVALVLAVLMGRWLITSITGPLQAAVKVADAVADGDLSSNVPQGGNDEAGQMLQSLARMQERLAQTVGSVRVNAEQVATASGEIAMGNADLSQRTEEQASALQQTSATMNQLGSTVRGNADSARQADQLASSASTAARNGGAVVAQVVSTMQGISESSRRIADINSVIDGIAFQTNILALNAAVEAARAGEQGRGFAVVASEVRSLAQRSADAAKEIKTLITRSVEQVETGEQQVSAAGAAMDSLVQSIQRVTDIVAEISVASKEQADGVQQVEQAVQQMDNVTQQNAALVEQSAAAAESLRQQAQALVASVAGFKLGGGTAQKPAQNTTHKTTHKTTHSTAHNKPHATPHATPHASTQGRTSGSAPTPARRPGAPTAAKAASASPSKTTPSPAPAPVSDEWESF
jgi:methyl-accepting chemotaxis protein